MDVDIDVQDTFPLEEVFPTAIRASMVKGGELKPHQVGVYFQNIPVDGITKLSSIPYKQAEEIGYFKIDLLHLSLLNYFDSKNEIRYLMKKQPDWSLLMHSDVVEKLFQLHNNFELVYKIKPTSVQEIADCIALIRPSKLKLQNTYLKAKTPEQKKNIRKFLYSKPEGNQQYFKKGHAIAYAFVIILQLHLIKAEIL